MGEIKIQGLIMSPTSYQLTSPAFRSMSINPTIPEIRLFKNLTLTSKIKVMGEVNSPSIQCISCLFHMNPLNYSNDMTNKIFDYEKTAQKFWKIIQFQQNSSTI